MFLLMNYAAAVAEDKLTAQIFGLVEHYKQADPVGLPGAPVPDPFDVPKLKKAVSMVTITMDKSKAYGMSKFRLKSIKTDLNALTVGNISEHIFATPTYR